MSLFLSLQNEFNSDCRQTENGDRKIILIQELYSTCYRLDDREFEARQGLGIFLFTTASRPALGHTQPPIQWVPGALSLGVKRLGREADHSPPSSSEVKNAWRNTSTPQYAFIARYSVKARGQLSFPWSTIRQYEWQRNPHLLTHVDIALCLIHGKLRKAKKWKGRNNRNSLKADTSCCWII
jgi:hypothetical protein